MSKCKWALINLLLMPYFICNLRILLFFFRQQLNSKKNRNNISNKSFNNGFLNGQNTDISVFGSPAAKEVKIGSKKIVDINGLSIYSTIDNGFN